MAPPNGGTKQSFSLGGGAPNIKKEQLQPVISTSTISDPNAAKPAVIPTVDTVIFIAESSPNLKIRVKDGIPPEKDLYVKFVNKKAELHKEKDAEAIELLRGFIANKQNIAQIVKEVDRERALRVAAAHQKETAAKNSATKGGMQGADMHSRMTDAHQNNIRQKLLAEGHMPDQVENTIKELAGANYVVPVTGDPPVSTPEDGFKKGEQADESKPKPKLNLTDMIQPNPEPARHDLATSTVEKVENSIGNTAGYQGR